MQNLIRAGWKNVFGIPDSENVSPAGEGSDWVKEIHCCKSGMEVYLTFFSSVYKVEFEQVNVCWASSIVRRNKAFPTTQL